MNGSVTRVADRSHFGGAGACWPRPALLPLFLRRGLPAWLDLIALGAYPVKAAASRPTPRCWSHANIRAIFAHIVALRAFHRAAYGAPREALVRML